MDANLQYHNLKLDNNSRYLTAFSCLFGRYQYIGLPFEAAPFGDLVQKKTDELFSSMLNAFGIDDDILIAEFDKHGRDYNELLEKAL